MKKKKIESVSIFFPCRAFKNFFYIIQHNCDIPDYGGPFLFAVFFVPYNTEFRRRPSWHNFIKIKKLEIGIKKHTFFPKEFSNPKNKK